MALTNVQTRVKQTTRVEIISEVNVPAVQNAANNFIIDLESSGKSYSINIGDPVLTDSSFIWLRITYILIEVIIEEPEGV